MRGALSRYPISATWIAATALAVLIVYLIPTGANGLQHPTTETVFVPAPNPPDRPPPPDDPPARPKGQSGQPDGRSSPKPPAVDADVDGPVVVGLPPRRQPPPSRPPVRPGPPAPAPVKPHPPKGKKAGWQDEFRKKMGEWRCAKQPKAC